MCADVPTLSGVPFNHAHHVLPQTGSLTETGAPASDRPASWATLGFTCFHPPRCYGYSHVPLYLTFVCMLGI